MNASPPAASATDEQTSLHLGGMAEGTSILTAKGLVNVEDLSAGDRILTRDKGAQQVSLITQRFMGLGEVLHVSPAAVGHPDDGTEIVVVPSQRLVLRDWRAKAMFDRSIALVSAKRLIDGEYVRRRPAQNLRIFSLHFDALRIIYSGDIELGTATPVTQMFGA